MLSPISPLLYYITGAYVRVYIVHSVQRPEVDLWCLPQLLPTLIFDMGSTYDLEQGWPTSKLTGPPLLPSPTQ